MSKATEETTTATAPFDPLAHEPPEGADPMDLFAHWNALEAAYVASCAAGGAADSPAEKAVVQFSRLADRALHRLAATEAMSLLGVQAKLSALHYEIDRDPPPSPHWRLLLASIEGDVHRLHEMGGTGR